MKKDKKEKKSKVDGVKERRFPKFHVLDAVIIILVIAIVAGVYFRYNVVDQLGNLKNQQEATVTFSVKNIKADTAKHYAHMDDAFEAAKTGAYIHGLAGDIAADNIGQWGMTAVDIEEALPAALKQIVGK